MRHTWEIVIRLRPTIVVAALAFLILAVPSQMHELYLVDIENVRLEWHNFWKLESGHNDKTTLLQLLANSNAIWCAMLAGMLAMLVLWLTSAHLICLAPDRETWNRGRRWLAAVLIVLIALAPVLGVLLGLINVLGNLAQIVPAGEGKSGAAEELRGDLDTYIGVSIGLALVAAAVFSFLTFARIERVAAAGKRLFSPTGVVAGISIILAFTATIAIWPTRAPWAIGTQALVYLFIASLAFVLTWFSDIYRRTGWPVTVAVIAAAVVFSTLGWNDNHRVDHKIVTTGNTAIEKNFEAWLLARADRKWFAEQGIRYPVYVVAAEGGGMFAGYHAADWLGRMQDRCRGFAQHTFAISSVSGGSLGAAVFAALAHRLATNEETRPCSLQRSAAFAGAARQFFRNDLLAPLVGATLFPDFIQRLLPLPIKALDRANALEEAFSSAWDRVAWTQGGAGPDVSTGQFRRPVHSLWDPKGATPALFLNTTSVAAGTRVAIGPLQFQPNRTALHLNSTLCAPLDDRSTVVDLPLATAVSLSARFPWLTPAGWLDLSQSKCPDRAERDRVYLVDGGYFENSGLETAIELVQHMHLAVNPGRVATSEGIDLDKLRAEYPHGIEIKIIMIFAIDGLSSRYVNLSAERSGSRPGELLPPLQSMLAGRTARTRATHTGTIEYGQLPFTEFGGGFSYRYEIDPKGDVRYGQDAVHQVWLDGKRFFLPLGWRLSERSIATISGSWRGLVKRGEFVALELDGKETDVEKGRPPKQEKPK